MTVAAETPTIQLQAIRPQFAHFAMGSAAAGGLVLIRPERQGSVIAAEDLTSEKRPFSEVRTSCLGVARWSQLPDVAGG